MTDRTCRRGHKVSGENAIKQGKYTVCRECAKMSARKLYAKKNSRKIVSKIELSEDVRFLLDNPDSLPNWDGIREWIVRTFGQSRTEVQR